MLKTPIRPLALAVICASAISSGCWRSEPSADEYLDSAKSFFEQGDYDRARVQLRNALRQDPQRSQAYYYLSLISEQKGNVYVAYADIQRARELAPKDPAIAVKAAEYLVLTAQFKQAEEAMSALLSKHSDHIKGHEVWVASLIGLQRYSKALQVADKALEWDADNEELLALKVVTLKFLKLYPVATKVLDRLISQHPDQISHQLLKLELAQLQNDAVAYQNALEALASLQPSNERFPMTLAQGYYREGNEQKALDILKQFNQNNPDNTAVKRILLELVEQQNPAEALKLLDSFIEQLPSDPGLQFYRVGRLLAGNGVDRAIPILQGMVADETLDPKAKAQAHIMLARLFFASQEQSPELAAEQIEQALTYDPLNRDALVMQAQYHGSNDDFDAALVSVERALSHSPDDVELLLLQASIFSQQGRPQAARSAHQKVLSIDANNVVAREAEFKRLLNEGELYDAQTLWYQASSDVQQSLDWQLRALELLLAQEQWRKAQKRLTSITAQVDLGWRADYFSAQILAGLGQSNKAVDTFKQVIQAEPHFVAAYDDIYEVLQPSQLVSFEKWLNAFAKQQPSAIPAVMLLSTIAQNRQDKQSVERYLQQGLEANPEWLQGYKLLSDHYLSNTSGSVDQGDKALALLKKGLELNSDNPFLLLVEASALASQKQYDRAVNNYEKLLKSTPNSLAVKNNYASLLVDDAVRSEESIRKAVILTQLFARSDDPRMLDTYGWVLFWAKEYKAAEHALKIALDRRDQRDPTIEYHLAEVYFASDKLANLDDLLSRLLTRSMPQSLSLKVKDLQERLQLRRQ